GPQGKPKANCERQFINNLKKAQQSSKTSKTSKTSSKTSKRGGPQGKPKANSVGQCINHLKKAQQSSKKKMPVVLKRDDERKMEDMEFVKIFEQDGLVLARINAAGFPPSSIEMQLITGALLVTFKKNNVNGLLQSRLEHRLTLPPDVVLEDIFAIEINGMLTIIAEKSSHFRKRNVAKEVPKDDIKIYEEKGVFIARIKMLGYTESSIKMMHRPGLLVVSAHRVMSNGMRENETDVNHSIPLPPQVKTEDVSFIVMNDTMTIVAECRRVEEETAPTASKVSTLRKYRK
uniref:uncharacterized protein n=1 Tax=Myxine glutinosa TaxID=7769 RepID=UPI00358EBC40